MKKIFNSAGIMGSLLLTSFGNKALAACSAAEKANGCVDLISPKTTDVGSIVVNITNWIVGLVGFVAVLLIIWAGVQYVTSSGNKERIESAKQTLTYAVIGIIVVVLARVIVGLVTGTAGSLFGR